MSCAFFPNESFGEFFRIGSYSLRKTVECWKSSPFSLHSQYSYSFCSNNGMLAYRSIHSV